MQDMAAPEEIIALRRLMESVNRQAASNAQSMGKLTTDVTMLRQEIAQARQAADRAIQMCNELATRLGALERK
jgi:chromosome segregation ATPase